MLDALFDLFGNKGHMPCYGNYLENHRLWESEVTLEAVISIPLFPSSEIRSLGPGKGRVTWSHSHRKCVSGHKPRPLYFKVQDGGHASPKDNSQRNCHTVKVKSEVECKAWEQWYELGQWIEEEKEWKRAGDPVYELCHPLSLPLSHLDVLLFLTLFKSSCFNWDAVY